MSFVFAPRSIARLWGSPLGRASGLLAALTLAFAVIGCSAKVTTTVAETPTTEPPSKPEPPPKKKCESLDEKCAGEAGARVVIVDSEHSIEPVSGWIYAKESDATVSQLDESGAAFAAVGHDVPDPKKEIEAREATLAMLAAKVGLVLPKKKVNWAKPTQVMDIGALKVSMWQIDRGTKRGEKAGVLLIVGAPLPNGKSLLGIAYVPNDDTTSADGAIMTSIETILPEGSKP